MTTSESAEIEAVKIQLEAILEEQGRQICELQQRMNQDTLHSKSLENQLEKEREMWKGKEKMFNTKVKQLEKELADLRNIIQHEAHPEKALLSRLNKDVAQKEQLIAGLKNNLGKERSRNKELEQQMLQLQLQQKQLERDTASTEQGKTKTIKDSPKGNTARRKNIEKRVQKARTSSGENVKLNVGPEETAEEEEQLESVSVLFRSQPDSMEDSESSPNQNENPRVDYSECCNCHKILVDHVIFPCCHGYCIQCFQVFVSEGLKNGENLLWCRFCEERFAVALHNCLKIPLELNRHVRKLAMRHKRPCEHCIEQKDSEFFCIQCEQCLCSDCSSEHINYSTSRTLHMLLAIRIPIFHSEVLDPEFYFCGEHSDNRLDFYCDNCEHLICIKCFAGHNAHRLSGIDDYSSALKDKMKIILSDMNYGILYFTRMTNSFKRLQRDYYHRILRIRESVAKNVDIMKYCLEKQAETLNRELDFIAKFSEDGVTSTQNDCENCMTELQQFRLHVEEFIDGAQSSHLACFGEDLLERAKDLTQAVSDKKFLLQNLGVCKGEHAFHPVNISFAPNKPTMQVNTKNLVGELKTKTVKGWAAATLHPEWINTIKPGSVVNYEAKEFAGLTTLGDELYVATRGNSFIEVYDLITFKRKQFLSLSTMTNIHVSDITACTTNNCLYVYGCIGGRNGILKPDIGGGVDLKEMWVSVGYNAGRLSVTDEGNIIVTGCNTNRLSEYTAEGKLSLDLSLEPETGVLHLWHALRTGSGHFVVSHGIVSDTVQEVCLVDREGMVLRSYGGINRGQLDTPMYLAFGERGCIIVADLNNKRVLQLSALLDLNEELISEKAGLRWPCRIHFDLVTGRLFVANSTFLENWEVLIFET